MDDRGKPHHVIPFIQQPDNLMAYTASASSSTSNHPSVWLLAGYVLQHRQHLVAFSAIPAGLNRNYLLATTQLYTDSNSYSATALRSSQAQLILHLPRKMNGVNDQRKVEPMDTDLSNPDRSNRRVA